MSGMKRMKMERPPFIEGGVCPVTMTAAAAAAGRRGRGGRLAFKDDAGYIGYLTDDESGSDSGGSSMEMVYRRRRDELLGRDGGFDLSFSVCLLVITAFVVLVLWGLRPPTAPYCSGVAP
jgi:hypothetical protein